MKGLLVFAAAVVMAVMASGLLLAQSSPFVGTWKLNPAKSKFTSGAPAIEEMATIQTVGDQDEVTVNGTAADGSPISMKYEMPTKGGAGKFLAGPYDAVSGKIVYDHTREASYMKGGKEILHLTPVVSKDGNTMKVTVKGMDAQGKPVSGVSVWEKQ
jgi:hypothetical protein